MRVAHEFSPWETVGKPERSRRDVGRRRTRRRRTVSAACRALRTHGTGLAARLRRRARCLCSNRRARERGAQVAACRLARAHRVPCPPRRPSTVWPLECPSTPWRADALTLPAVSYRVAPALLIGLLVLGGGLFAAGGVALVYLARPRRAPAPPPEPEAPPPRVLSLLEQALALLEDAVRADGAEDRRPQALELVAEVLGEHGDPDLARSARMLAWSEREPVVEETTAWLNASVQNSSSRRAASTRRTAVRFRPPRAGRPRQPRRPGLPSGGAQGAPLAGVRGRPRNRPARRRVASARGLDARERGLLLGDATGRRPTCRFIAEDTLEVRMAPDGHRGGRPVGLVVFSDVPYELLPPGTPASAMRPSRCACSCPRSSARRCTRWSQTFSAGTRAPPGSSSRRRCSSETRSTIGSSSSSATSRRPPTTCRTRGLSQRFDAA